MAFNKNNMVFNLADLQKEYLPDASLEKIDTGKYGNLENYLKDITLYTNESHNIVYKVKSPCSPIQQFESPSMLFQEENASFDTLLQKPSFSS